MVVDAQLQGATPGPADVSVHPRYPGPHSFSDDAVDRRLFFGREAEAEELLHRVQATRMLVLFGKSGLGKTSLLQAGLFPSLREHGFWPIPLRLNHRDVQPVPAVIAAVLESCQRAGVDCEAGERDSLWTFFKTTQLWRGETLQVPVLVLDQFEEVFTLQGPGFRRALATELRQLYTRGLPAAVRARRAAGEKLPYSDTLPDLRIIFSLREEYVGVLEELVAEVPAILEQRFRLLPLSLRHARCAIVEPSGVSDSGKFATAPFSYSKAALDTMLAFLQNRAEEVEPFQLQIICQNVEGQVAVRQAQDAADIEVDDTLLGGTRTLERILDNFYRDALRTVRKKCGRWQRRRTRRLCQDGLLSPEGRRVSVDESSIRRRYKLKPKSLAALIETRLVRKETRPGLEGFYYELSHDSLAGPVGKHRQRRRLVWAAVSLFTVVIALASIALQRTHTVEQVQQAKIQVQQAEKQVQQAERQVAQVTDVSREATLELIDLGGLRVPEMVEIPPGTFRVGDIQGGGKKNGRAVREVRIVKPFKIGRYEVTFEEYDQFASATGRVLPDDQGWGRSRRPVINVGWDDALAYSEWLSAATGKRYRLPTEAEWEYAARAGTETTYWWGNDIRQDGEVWANCHGCGSQWDGEQAAPVGSFKPNAFDVYDTAGNVWEWVQDCWHDSYEGGPDDGSAWEEAGGGDCDRRVFRGGSWLHGPRYMRFAYRNWNDPDIRFDGLGFCLARDLPSLGQIVGSVVSSAGPSPGQQNRSSHNFSTTGAKGSSLLWRVLVNGEEDASIRFNVMEDIRLAIDPTHLSGLRSGTTTQMVRNGSLYIANPQGARGEFTVEVYVACNDLGFRLAQDVE